MFNPFDIFSLIKITWSSGIQKLKSNICAVYPTRGQDREPGQGLEPQNSY